MYYRLRENYLLRGWEGMAWVLVQRPKNRTIRLSQEAFQALLLCDGETDLTGDLLDEAAQKALAECEEKGYVEPSETPAPLDSDQYYKYYHNRYVRRVFWSITGRCNFRCRHCYMDAPDSMLGELSTEEALALIDQMAECGVLTVDLTGGEPLVRKDFWQLVDRICSHKMHIAQLYTNGWLLTDEVLDKFERRGLKPEILISFDGVGWHDWMRGRPGAEQAALRAFQLATSRGYFVHASMCIHRGNAHTLPETVAALRAVGVNSLKTANVDQTDLWRCHSDGNDLDWNEYIETMIPYIDWYYRAGRPIRKLEFGGVASLAEDKPGGLCISRHSGTEDCMDDYLCGAVRWACYITPDGRLLPCMPMTASPQQEVFPKVQEIGLRQGLSGSYYMNFVNARVRDLMAVNQECAGCEHRYKCGGGCRANALTSGECELMGCDRRMCNFWKNDYDERIMQAIQAAEAKWGAPAGQKKQEE